MNRLASFYSVSAGDAEHAAAAHVRDDAERGRAEARPHHGRAIQRRHRRIRGATARPDVASPAPLRAGRRRAHGRRPAAPKDVHGTISMPDRPVGTEIDSVGTLPAAHDDHSWPAGARDPGRADRDRHAGSPSARAHGVRWCRARASSARTGTRTPSPPRRARRRRTPPGPRVRLRAGSDERPPWGVPPAPGRARHAAACRAAGRPARPVVSRAVLRVPKAAPLPAVLRDPGPRARPARTCRGRAAHAAQGRRPDGLARPTRHGDGRGAAGNFPGRHRPHRSARCHGRPRSTETTGRSSGAGRRIPGSSEAVTGPSGRKGPASRAGRNGFTSGAKGWSAVRTRGGAATRTTRKAASGRTTSSRTRPHTFRRSSGATCRP